MEGVPVPLYGRSLNVRDWIYVLDNCRALDTVLRLGATGEVYNVGAANEVTNRHITGSLLELLGAGARMRSRRVCCLFRGPDRRTVHAALAITWPTSPCETPRASSDFTSRSTDTEASAASILATRD